MLFRKSKRAAVFGCGPAGLFAAHALVQKGWDVEVYSKKRRSEMFGAQYLHRAIPGLDGETDPAELDYQLHGTIDAYRGKVYGFQPVHSVSPSTLVGKHQVWDIRRAYFDAWDRYQGLVYPVETIDQAWFLYDFDPKPYRWIINTIPRPALCNGTHQFRSADVWAMGDAPERGQYVPYKPPAFTVVCNGEDSPGWYRASNIYGFATIEWPEDRKPPIPGVAKVSKPIGHNCTCLDVDWLVHFGRYGAWDKSYLSHQAYQDAMGLA